MADDTGGVRGSAVAGIFGVGQQVNQMAEDAKKLLANAKAGKWAVDEETGTHLKRAFTQMQDRLNDIAGRLWRLERAPMLGNDDYAKAVAQHGSCGCDGGLGGAAKSIDWHRPRR
ncbi:hypothetical protein [Amycolatopsis taiwanensis]|uniref:Uncharacterized protein n=1 Tax=Amycolatopsis taiwanensis TaxID=342230 RepID=A0A9W6VFL8_9PSEU|nr:hypothetical protein [Amycolatopsis taiwanensis]GLY65004.1 hypothetical protein Atai01_16230 [Amycolatopsis taiwanensis]